MEKKIVGRATTNDGDLTDRIVTIQQDNETSEVMLAFDSVILSIDRTELERAIEETMPDDMPVKEE